MLHKIQARCDGKRGRENRTRRQSKRAKWRERERRKIERKLLCESQKKPLANALSSSFICAPYNAQYTTHINIMHKYIHPHSHLLSVELSVFPFGKLCSAAVVAVAISGVRLMIFTFHPNRREREREIEWKKTHNLSSSF